MLVAGLDKPSLVFLLGFQATSPSLQHLAQVLASTEHKKGNAHNEHKDLPPVQSNPMSLRYFTLFREELIQQKSRS